MYPNIVTGQVLTAVEANALRTQLEASVTRENALADRLRAAEAERDALRSVAHEATTRLKHLAYTEIRDQDGRLTNAERLYELVFRGAQEIGHDLARYLRDTRRPSAADHLFGIED